MIIGTGIVFWAQGSQLYICTSVPQMEVLRTRMRTSSPPTSGMGTSCNQSPGSAFAFTTAFIVFCTGESYPGAMQMSILRVFESSEMMDEMPTALEQTASETARPRAVFIPRFISTVLLWSIALFIAFTGYEILFWLLISAFGLIALWEFYRMLDHRGLPNFKFIGLLCGAVMLAGSFHYFSTIGPASSYDFEVAVLLFFLLTVFGRQMFAGLRHDEPLQTMAYTLFGLLYVLWLFNFTTKIL